MVLYKKCRSILRYTTLLILSVLRSKMYRRMRGGTQDERADGGFALLLVLAMLSLLMPLALFVWSSSDFISDIAVQRLTGQSRRLLVESVMQVCTKKIATDVDAYVSLCAKRKDPLLFVFAKKSTNQKTEEKIIATLTHAPLAPQQQSMMLDVALVAVGQRLYSVRCLLHKGQRVVQGKKEFYLELSHVSFGDFG